MRTILYSGTIKCKFYFGEMKVEVKVIIKFSLPIRHIIMVANTPNGFSSTSQKKQSTTSRLLNSYNGPAKWPEMAKGRKLDDRVFSRKTKACFISVLPLLRLR
jgi:hypothetical protein